MRCGFLSAATCLASMLVSTAVRGGEAAYTYHPNTFTVLTYKPH